MIIILTTVSCYRECWDQRCLNVSFRKINCTFVVTNRHWFTVAHRRYAFLRFNNKIFVVCRCWHRFNDNKFPRALNEDDKKWKWKPKCVHAKMCSWKGRKRLCRLFVVESTNKDNEIQSAAVQNENTCRRFVLFDITKRWPNWRLHWFAFCMSFVWNVYISSWHFVSFFLKLFESFFLKFPAFNWLMKFIYWNAHIFRWHLIDRKRLILS